MDHRRFDRWTARVSGLRSRRALLWAMLGIPALGMRPAVAQPPPDPICRGYRQTCDARTDACCPDAGLHCTDGRCRCRRGHTQCNDTDPGCTDLARDARHCGRCGNRCPASKPCCINGKCAPKCGNRCCPNCFVEVMENGQPKPDVAICCGRDDGTLCGGPRRRQRCCYPDEACLDDRCCGVTNRGLTDCDGRCCAADACCDGACCPAGRVCGTPAGAAGPRCVSGDRSCGSAGDCHPGEACDGGTCCAGLRRCFAGSAAAPICCPVGEWCAIQQNPTLANCIPVGESPSRTYRGHRVRP